MSYSEGPEFFSENVWPLGNSVDKDGSGGLRNNPDMSLRYPILPMSSDGAKSQVLASSWHDSWN